MAGWQVGLAPVPLKVKCQFALRKSAFTELGASFHEPAHRQSNDKALDLLLDDLDSLDIVQPLDEWLSH